MPRRRPRKQELDFEIHPDEDSRIPSMAEGHVKDFSGSESRRESFDGGPSNEATESTFNKASTLVNGDDGETDADDALKSQKRGEELDSDEEESEEQESTPEPEAINPDLAKETSLEPDIKTEDNSEEEEEEEEDDDDEEESEEEEEEDEEEEGEESYTEENTRASASRRESNMTATSEASDASSVYSEQSKSHVSSARPSDAHSAQESEANESILESVEGGDALDEEHDTSVVDDEHSLAGTERRRSLADEGENSSNHDEDDVFSNHSPRSSVGSLSDPDPRKMADNVTQRSHSTRVSGASGISTYDYEEDDEDFVPTTRNTPRPPFRSPSSVKAMQMSSPPGSVSGSSRSGRRTAMPTVSRVSSPSLSAQYSPKKTPPRFKRNTPPLVLLHVTLLPLRWPWGEVLENIRVGDLTEGGKNLRDSWRQLQDRLGDTVCERGILLPHPQNDFEVLEERLLEALELPLKRRARILECGHYLGPSNEVSGETDSEADYSEDEQQSHAERATESRHWCGTCRSEIKFDSLGVGKIFRVKVYASNGLMRAGAWEACWKDMERVDVELEPIVDPEIQKEIDHHAAEQERALELHQEALEEQALADELAEKLQEEEMYKDESTEEASFTEQDRTGADTPSSPSPGIKVDSPADEQSEHEKRSSRESGERHRSPSAQPPHSPPHQDQKHRPDFESRDQADAQSHKNDSLPALALQAIRVAVTDMKNVALALMSILVVLLALKVAGSDMRDVDTFDVIKDRYEAPALDVTHPMDSFVESVAPDMETAISSVAASIVSSVEMSTVEEASVSSETPYIESGNSHDQDVADSGRVQEEQVPIYEADATEPAAAEDDAPLNIERENAEPVPTETIAIEGSGDTAAPVGGNEEPDIGEEVAEGTQTLRVFETITETATVTATYTDDACLRESSAQQTELGAEPTLGTEPLGDLQPEDVEDQENQEDQDEPETLKEAERLEQPSPLEDLEELVESEVLQEVEDSEVFLDIEGVVESEISEELGDPAIVQDVEESENADGAQQDSPWESS
ncbi:hypothetical protein N3K66_003917 [Trichothecium roseum]|uniref:Uncharacterized protein n=1 Tax=Trichothecium roseum TaxID=47278 RepID=A0ACC0V6T1_9HYPO|nr:hypothetical protein N3K66_003917 [Trichothecium roseum]